MSNQDNKTKIVASIFVWILSGVFSLFAIATIEPIAMAELGYIPIYALVVIFMPIAIGSAMLAKTLMEELPKTKRFS